MRGGSQGVMLVMLGVLGLYVVFKTDIVHRLIHSGEQIQGGWSGGGSGAPGAGGGGGSGGFR